MAHIIDLPDFMINYIELKNISKLTLAEKIEKQEKMRKIPDKKKK